MSKSESRPRTGFFLWLFELDRILRGESTRPDDLQQSDIKIPVLGISIVVLVLALIYGFCMGIFALVRGIENSEYQQALLQTFASMCKVPLLFLLTLLVTFPSLYVFNALVGSQLRVVPVLKLLVASLAVNLAVLASMGPILAFFSVSTPNYSFIVLLNVVVFAIAGMLGLVFLIQTLNRLTLADRGRNAVVIVENLPAGSPRQATDTDAQSPAASNSERPGPLDQLEGVVFGRHVRTVFACWIVVFGLVGAQMGWVLRPFIGAPGTPFQWLRARDSNFFESVFETLQNLIF